MLFKKEKGEEKRKLKRMNTLSTRVENSTAHSEFATVKSQGVSDVIMLISAWGIN